MTLCVLLSLVDASVLERRLYEADVRRWHNTTSSSMMATSAFRAIADKLYPGARAIERPLPFQLLANRLIFHSQNNAWRVETAIENIGKSAAFQSEKTGSTPVGSAICEQDCEHPAGVKWSTFGKHCHRHGYDDEKYAALLKWERELRRILAFAVEDNVVELKRA